MNRRIILLLLCHIFILKALAQNVIVSIDPNQNKRAISPYIYGRNQTFEKPVQFYKDAGLRFSRMNGGNNATCYNWRKKITVHPDWYNNVYPADWDGAAQNIATNYPDMQGMFAFQLLGRAGSNTNNNFNDWAFNQSQYWAGVSQNLAGGGTPNTQNPSGKALIEGDLNLFTQLWPADSSVGILNYWFGNNGLGLNKNQFIYWSMDNEVDIWNGTHDYAMPVQTSSAAFMDHYIELAKKAKALYPGIKLCGPVTTSEWQWYKWSNEGITINGRYYCWLEYFIKRLADEYKATGTKLVDVVDIHNYPYFATNTDALQLHRMYYDTLYDYPGANGLKTITGGWDNSLSREYIFKRINDWLNEHFGANHGITVGLSEWSPGPNEPNLASVIYASHLGTFANNGVEFFSPWTWFTGMWETLHLFSRYAKKYSVSSTSSNENIVSAYTSVNENADSLSIMLVNRDMSASRTVTININNFGISNGNYKTLQLASLPSTETFTSHTQNALVENSATVTSNSLTITVPALSTTAILLNKPATSPVTYVSLTNKATGLLMDGLYNFYDGSSAGQWHSSGSQAQQWVIETVGSYVKIKNRASGLYLDGLGSTNNGANVAQKTASSSFSQQWSQIPSGTDIKFNNRATGQFIDGLGTSSDGSNLGQWQSSNSNNQVWTIGSLSNLAALNIASESKMENRLELYPNPFSTSFNVRLFKTEQNVLIRIYDLAGRQMESTVSSGPSQVLMGASLKPGIYIARINGAKLSQTFKVVKINR